MATIPVNSDEVANTTNTILTLVTTPIPIQKPTSTETITDRSDVDTTTVFRTIG